MQARAARCARSTACRFDIEPGEFFGLLGPNGAGKTTLISILAGLTRATRGRVAVMGHDVVADYAAARKALGMVPQELVFDPFFNVREACASRAATSASATTTPGSTSCCRAGPRRQGATPTCGSSPAA